MAVTVSGKNYTQLSGCESTTDGGAWTVLDAPDNVNFKEGSNSLAGTMKASGINTATFTPTSVVDMSGTKHLRMWFIDSAAGLLDTKANGGIQLGITDGVNTGYWNLGGKDTYNGGWLNLVVDLSSSVDVGTKPTSMNAITVIYLRITQTAAGKNFDNVWGDNLCLADGLIVYGDDGGGYFDFEDIFLGDDAATLGIGIVRKIGGQYFCTGSIEIGDSAGINGCKFQAKSQVFVFEDRPVNSSLYGFNIVDNGTGTTEFILGAKSGTAGIQGCNIRTESESQAAKYYIDGFTDTDVDNFKLYGSSFFDAGTITFGKAAATTEVLGCSFESCLQVIPKDAVTKDCFFINTSDVDAALLWNETINIQDCSFIGNTAGAGIEHPSAVGTPYAYNNQQFSGNTYDVLNSSGSAITVNKTNGANPATSEGSAVTFSGSVSIDINVKDKSEVNIVGALVYVDDDLGVAGNIVNTTTDSNGNVNTSYSGAKSLGTIRVRKYGYKPFTGTVTLLVNSSTNIILAIDPQQT